MISTEIEGMDLPKKMRDLLDTATTMKDGLAKAAIIKAEVLSDIHPSYVKGYLLDAVSIFIKMLRSEQCPGQWKDLYYYVDDVERIIKHMNV